jgi:hypothetical protein
VCNRWQVQAPQNIWPAATLLVVEKGDPVSSAHQTDVAMVLVHDRVVGHLVVPPTGPGDMTFGSVIASIVIQEWHQVRARVQGLEEWRDGEIVEHLDGLLLVCSRIDNVPDVQYRKVTHGSVTFQRNSTLTGAHRRRGTCSDAHACMQPDPSGSCCPRKQCSRFYKLLCARPDGPAIASAPS